MLGREITDAELVELDAGTSTLDPTEQVEGLRARVRRLERLDAIAEEQRRNSRERAVAEALVRGGPGVFNRWRNWDGTPFDYGEVCVAIVEALTQEGVQAWIGDGVSIVAQMVEAGHDRAVKAEKEREELGVVIDGLVQVLTEANVGEHAWDCPANGKMERLASCDCGHPESSPLSVKARAALAAAKALRK